MRTLHILAAMLLAAAGAAHADTLTADAVDRWMSSMADVQEWAERADIDDPTQDLGEGQGPQLPDFHVLIEQLGPAAGDLDSLVRDHGFDGADDWAETSNRVLRGFMAAMMQGQAGQMDAAIQEALSQVENDPNLSDAQREQMRTQIESQAGGFDQMMSGLVGDVPAEDREAVEAHLDRLQEFFEQSQ